MCLPSCDPHAQYLGHMRQRTDVSICFALKELSSFYIFPPCTQPHASWCQLA